MQILYVVGGLFVRSLNLAGIQNASGFESHRERKNIWYQCHVRSCVALTKGLKESPNLEGVWERVPIEKQFLVPPASVSKALVDARRLSPSQNKQKKIHHVVHDHEKSYTLASVDPTSR
jgi:hypothetical protein